MELFYVVGAVALCWWFTPSKKERESVRTLCDVLEDPAQIWTQGRYEIIHESGMHIWTANSVAFVKVNGAEAESFHYVSRWRIWQSVHIARQNEIFRKAGVELQSSNVIDLRPGKITRKSS